ncbi:putative short chain dehydrogenase reductase protein [Rosellinia necatrix]|uniref:Putative short chain dehydrogenase reductase protein n=1 Tax=Rosellinia necatrix TaxID=77044 RepID=A0A1W2TNZ7_ROSNE|nr:putative short chain dehydrogenase reductase protein [Rosellinia necatrix]
MSAIYSKLNTAVITGGASGIGLALTKKCVGHGMRVLVADWDQKNLDAAKSALGDGISTIRTDVSKTEDWAVLREKVVKDFGGKINLLALNAGTQAPVTFDDADTGGFEKILRTNLFGVINGITTLLPLIKSSATTAGSSSSSPSSSIVITGSKQGITNPPGNPAYNASKAAVKTLAEHLSFDLAASHPGAVSVHLLVPGWTWTQLAGASSGREKPAAAWTPEQVVDYLEAKMAEGQFWVLCPDNDVTEDMDRRRMQWNTDDALLGRPPLSRWRDAYKDEFKAYMEKK